ncbi:MAG: hypothetical protein K2Z81_09205, partial [Cyanobacteria bacterium]|nr:hypothetical protein [Cyanobacteriota bacterium]
FKRTLKALTVYLLMCTIYGATVNADHAGHFGGVFIGFLFGCVLTPVKQTHRRTAADLIMLALFFGAMVTFYFAESTGIADWSGKLLWMKANMLEEQNQYKRAIVLWETQLGRIGPNKVAYEGLARCYWKFGDYKNCLKNLNLTIEHGNESLPIIQWRAELYLKFNDYQKAIDDESTVLKAKPNDRRARYARVCAYRSTNQFENALADCKVLLEQKVDFIGLYAAAYTNYEIGNYDEALRLCELSSKETNDQTSSILLKTGIYSKQRKFDEAWETLDKAREMKGVNEIAIAVDEAEIFMDQGEPQKCSSILQKYLSKHPTDPSLLYSLTIYYLTQKDYAKTIETASRVLKLPDDDPMRRSYMSIIYYLAACKAAPETKDTFISEHLRDPRISSLFVKHLMQFLLGQITEKELLTGAENKANQTEAHYYIGFKLQQAGKQAEANEHYQWVVDNGIKTFLEYRLAKRALAAD